MSNSRQGDPVFFEDLLSRFNNGFEHGDTVAGMFFMLSLPDEVEELDPDDSVHFIAYEMSRIIGRTFTELCGDTFASWSNESNKTPLVLRVYGKTCCLIALGVGSLPKATIASASESPEIFPLPFSNDMLRAFADKLHSITGFNYDFYGEGQSIHEKPKLFGSARGAFCQTEFAQRISQSSESFCLDSVSGYSNISSLAIVNIGANGLFELKDYDLASFKNIYGSLSEMIHSKTDAWFESHISAWSESRAGGYLELTGRPIVYELPSPSPFISRVTQRLMRQEQSLQCFTIIHKAIQLDKQIVLIDSQNGRSIEVSLSPKMIQTQLCHPLSIQLAMRFEYFLQKHLNADIRFYEI